MSYIMDEQANIRARAVEAERRAASARMDVRSSLSPTSTSTATAAATSTTSRTEIDESDPQRAQFHKVLLAAAKLGHPDRAGLVLKAMLDADLPPGPRAWHSVIFAHVKAGDAFGALDATRSAWQAGITPLPESYSVLIYALMEADEVDKAVAVLQSMLNAEVEGRPGWLMLTTALFRKGAMKRALDFIEFGEEQGWAPNANLMEYVIEARVQTQGFQAGVDTVSEMLRVWGIRATASHWYPVIKGVPADSEFLRFLIFDGGIPTGQLDTEIFNLAMEKYARTGDMAHANEVLGRMEEFGISRDQRTHALMLECILQEGTDSGVGIFDEFQKMLKQGQAGTKFLSDDALTLLLGRLSSLNQGSSMRRIVSVLASEGRSIPGGGKKLARENVTLVSTPINELFGYALGDETDDELDDETDEEDWETETDDESSELVVDAWPSGSGSGLPGGLGGLTDPPTVGPALLGVTWDETTFVTRWLAKNMAELRMGADSSPRLSTEQDVEEDVQVDGQTIKMRNYCVVDEKGQPVAPSKLGVTELKAELMSRGLSVEGKRVDLYKRVQAARKASRPTLADQVRKEAEKKQKKDDAKLKKALEARQGGQADMSAKQLKEAKAEANMKLQYFSNGQLQYEDEAEMEADALVTDDDLLASRKVEDGVVGFGSDGEDLISGEGGSGMGGEDDDEEVLYSLEGKRMRSGGMMVGDEEMDPEDALAAAALAAAESGSSNFRGVDPFEAANGPSQAKKLRSLTDDSRRAGSITAIRMIFDLQSVGALCTLPDLSVVLEAAVVERKPESIADLVAIAMSGRDTYAALGQTERLAEFLQTCVSSALEVGAAGARGGREGVAAIASLGIEMDEELREAVLAVSELERGRKNERAKFASENRIGFAGGEDEEYADVGGDDEDEDGDGDGDDDDVTPRARGRAAVMDETDSDVPDVVDEEDEDDVAVGEMEVEDVDDDGEDVDDDDDE